MQRIFLIAFLHLLSGAGAMAAESDGEYRGTIECTGPYLQEIPGLPSGSIRLRLAWDRLFSNYDVELKIGTASSAGVTRLSWQYPIPRAASVPYLSGTLYFPKSERRHLVVRLREDRIPEGGPVDRASLESDERGYFSLRCQALNERN